VTIGSLFSGIGGLELGLEWARHGPVKWQVEIDAGLREILAKHWPKAKRYADVREVGKHNLKPVDLICGGFPCQDVSGAGKRAGIDGPRSSLWQEFARVVSELNPKWVVVENVASGATHWVDEVRGDLEQLGYESLPIPLEARFFGLPHYRERIFLLAHNHSSPQRREPGQQGAEKTQTEPGPLGYTRGITKSPTSVPTAGVRRSSHGVSNRLDRLTALGNSVAPSSAQVIGEVINTLENYICVTSSKSV